MSLNIYVIVTSIIRQVTISRFHTWSWAE